MSHGFFKDCKCITSEEYIRNVKDWEFLYNCYFETDADFVIQTHDDFFLYRPHTIDLMVEYMAKHKIHVAGPECCSVEAPIIDCWFFIANLNEARKFVITKAEKIEMRFRSTTEKFRKNEYTFTDAYHYFDKDEYFHLLMMEKGCRFHTLPRSYEIPLEDIMVAGKRLGIHTRLGRFYNIKKEEKKRIDKIFNAVVRRNNEKYPNNS